MRGVGEWFAAYDSEAPEGERFPAEVRTEIARLAPAAVTPNSITQEKIADEAVGTAQIQAKAVDATRLADGAVGQEQLANAAVASAQLAPGAVTGAKAGAGIAKAFDSSGVPIGLNIVPITETDYAALSPDPNTLYLLYQAT